MARRLATVQEPWFVTGGWAVDLFVGRVTREHHDIEVAVGPRGFEPLRRALETDGHELYAVGGGVARPATTRALAEHHQTWVRERTSGLWRLDVLREPWDDETWVFRRDRRVRRPLADVVARSDAGVPYARPEVVLLFKAKAPQEKDEADLQAALPLLDRPARCWLAAALELAYPGHRWLRRLRE